MSDNKKLEEVVFLVFIEIFILFVFRAFLPSNDNEFYYYAKIGLYIFDILFVLFMLKIIDHDRISSIGITVNNIRSQIIKGLIVFLVLLYSYVFPYYLIYGVKAANDLQLYQLAIHIFLNIFVFALAEEMLFRGLILLRLKQLLSSDTKAIFIGSLIFSISQYPLTHDATMLLLYVLLGLILSTIKLKFNVKLISLAIAHGMLLSVFDIIAFIVK